MTEPLTPVDNFTDAYPLLRRPFTPAAARFKIQATYSGGAMVVAFIDARLVAGRLNAVIPAKWSATYERPESGKGLICHLTVDGITRTDFGQSDYENAKGDYSDALKRAAVHFGVGESLYVLPKMFLKEGNLLKKAQRGLILTPCGEDYCRSIYREWLETSGSSTFGEPLDHGDQLPQPDDPDDVVGKVPTTTEGPPRSIDELGALIGEQPFDDDETAAIRAWLAPDGHLDDDRVSTAIDLLNEGNRAALLAGIKFEADPA